jgi:hypothetical protein
MRIIEIAALDNGAHRNQSGEFSAIPFGWAVAPDDLHMENFPFGEVVAERVDGVPTVTRWTPGVVPEKVDPIAEPTELEQLRADVDFIAMEMGVEL